MGDGVRMGPATDSDLCSWTAPRPEGAGRSGLARAGEQLAAAHLVHVHGLLPVALNLRVAVEGLRGELDVVVRDPCSGLLVVCEVKSRTAAGGAGAVESLGARQQARIRRMTGVLLAEGTLRADGVRFDLITLDLPTRRSGGVAAVRHLAGAW
jgi:Holliday junction resolvase-like predicted endonuclease